MVVFGQKFLYSGKVVAFGKRESIRAKVVLIGQKLFYTGRSGSIRAKVVVFGQSSCIRAKVLVIGQKWIYSGKSGSFRAKNGSTPEKTFV